MENNYDELIASLTKRVYHLEQEVIRLGGQPYNMSQKAMTTSHVGSDISVNTIEKPDFPDIPPVQESLSVSEANTINEEKSVSEANTVNVKNPASTSPKKKDMENKIGKNLMAILASVLIFFSLVLFAGIAFRYLSDTAKAVIMFVISTAIAVFGIIKMPAKNDSPNNKYSVFFTSLAACGIGAIYITLLVAYFGFKCISLIPFIISIAIWIIATMLLAYKRSTIFVYICNVGLIIATVLTTLQFENSMLGFVIYTVCLTALYLINRHDNYNLDCFYFIQYPIMFIVLSSVVETNIYMYIIFGVMLTLVFAYANFLYNFEKKHIATNIATAILNIAAIFRMILGTDNDLMAYVAITLLLLTMLMYFAKHYKSNPLLFYIVYVLTYITSVIVFLTTDMYIVVALVPYISFLILGFICKDLFIRCGGYFALFVSFCIHISHFNFWPVFAIYMLIIIAAYAFMLLKDYNVVDKYIATLTILAFIMSIIIEDKLNFSFVFIIYTLIAIVLNTKLFINNFNTKESELPSQIIAYIISGAMLSSGMLSIYNKSVSPEVYQVIIFSLSTLILCSVNTKKLFNTNLPELLIGSYIGLKYTILIYAILYRLGAASFIISVVGILIAIICIVLGFKVRHKSFRLYGLVVSLICVIKLILFDIKYDSLLLRPIGFFVAGILCFAISFIYSKLEVSLKQSI